jgi:hypothetical protein
MTLLALLACGKAAPTPESLSLCDSCDQQCSEEYQEPTSADHITGGVDYPDPPPSSGDHDPCWATWGVHTEPVPDENWVHNLEHGGVVYLYNCPDGCPDEQAALEGLVTDLGQFAVVTPYDTMPTRYAAISWGWRYLTDCFDIGAFQTFYEARKDQGPESNPTDPPADCEGG